MNRAHNALEAEACLTEAVKYFDNISIDLIYGIPGMTNERWLHNVDRALSFGVPHISSYALTVEPRTALDKFVKTKFQIILIKRRKYGNSIISKDIRKHSNPVQ